MRSGPAPWTYPNGSARCGPRWSGAWVCWTTPSGRCWRSRPCSPTAGPSRPQPGWRAWGRTGRWSCRRRWRATAWSMPTALGSGPGRGCWRPSASSWPGGRRHRPPPARADADQVGRRHADYYRVLAGQADRPLRGSGRSEWMERLQAESGNLAAAVRWYLAHDPGPLPHLFRVLWLFWTQQDLQREAWSWVEQLLPAPRP